MVVIVHSSLQQSWPSNGTPTRQEAQLVLALFYPLKSHNLLSTQYLDLILHVIKKIRQIRTQHQTNIKSFHYRIYLLQHSVT